MTQEVSNEAARREEPEVLVISFAKVGKDRYIWIAGTLGAWTQGRGPEHYGYVDSQVKAISECARAKDLLDPSRQLKCLVGRLNTMRMNVPAGYALGWHRRLSEEKRKEKLSDKTDSARVEFVYSTWYDFEEMTSKSCPHLVLKKTAKKIVVQSDSYRGPDFVWTRVRTFHLDRASLETTGRVWHKGSEFTLEPKTHDFAASHNQWMHEKAATLGVTWPCNRRDLIKAFRAKVKEVHPDKGGTDAKFIEVRKAFERLQAIAA